MHCLIWCFLEARGSLCCREFPKPAAPREPVGELEPSLAHTGSGGAAFAALPGGMAGIGAWAFGKGRPTGQRRAAARPAPGAL